MPVFSRIKWPFEGEEFTRVTSVNSAGIFTIRLPLKVAGRLGYDEVSGETRGVVEKRFVEALKTYQEMKITRRRVILYKINSASLRTRDYRDGLSVSITAAVCEEECYEMSDAVKRYRYNLVEECGLLRDLWPGDAGDLVDSRTDRAENQVEWTAEREEFFNMLGRGVSNIILALERLQGTEDLIRIADSGGFNLLAAPK